MAYIKAPCGGIKLNDSQFKVDKDGIISSESGGGGAVNSDATTLGGHAVDYFATAESVTGLDTDVTQLDTISKNIIKGDYLGTDSLFIDLTKSESGVKINITPITNIEDATTPEDMVTKFNTLLSELKTMGIM